MSISGVSKWFNSCISDVNQINYNKGKIANLQEDLAKFKKNPKFYGYKKILAIAASIAIVAATAVASFFTFSLGTPLFIAAVSGFSPSGMAAGGILMFMSAPLSGLGMLHYTVPTLYRNHQKDFKASIILQAENARLEQQLADKIAAKKVKMQRTSQQLMHLTMSLSPTNES